MSRSHFNELKLSSIIIIAADLIAILATYLINEMVLNKAFISDTFEYNWESSFVYPVIFMSIISLCILSVGLYNQRLRETFNGITIRIFVGILLAYFIIKLIFSITILDEVSANFSEYYLFSTFLALALVRYIISKTPYQSIGIRRVLVLGAGERAKIIEQYMRRKTDRIGIEFVAFIPMSGDSENGIKNETKIELNQPLEQFVLNHDIDEIVIACDERRNVLPNDSLFICKKYGIKITDIIDFFESETGQVAVNQIYPSWIIYGSTNYYNPLHKSIDWLFNCLIALVIFALTWPIMILTAFAIKLEDGWKSPILYSQKRTGLEGKTFDIYKFRSMKTDAEKDGVKWAQKSDPRVTKVGNFIRKYRIDELPQLFNVIRGDMGFVGPRPERPQFTEEFELDIPYYNHRFNVKPGLTGWAQLKYPYGSSKQDAVEKLKYDLYYIKNRGFLFDLLILLRTAEIILFGKGR
ncbi:TIGR03013 family XrtA/PEP-CTERM system glycosyltransferase [Vibrio salinus]|uniref:TIGR03013 family XrtA/PEP-CTERM system glycosyltransferase n=1 Tax=Vibrio salinus TaxID=2899784 RepID=UPI001E4EA55E|nr:TIGR03013 family XrtA/PEP-CTERM system glycosyltransferase [Vibrio salinus]MCE0493260.1 TIGR03013 family PEP-CTERM/XrtA system glycosyltransferase [Vibrio salinus]